MQIDRYRTAEHLIVTTFARSQHIHLSLVSAALLIMNEALWSSIRADE